MGTVIPLNNESTSIETIWCLVECPHCFRQFEVQMKKPHFGKNCRCGECTIHFSVTALRGSRVSVSAQAQVGFQSPVGLEILHFTLTE